MYYYVGSKVANIATSNESGYKYKVLLEYRGTIIPFPYYTNKEYNVGEEFDE